MGLMGLDGKESVCIIVQELCILVVASQANLYFCKMIIKVYGDAT